MLAIPGVAASTSVISVETPSDTVSAVSVGADVFLDYEFNLTGTDSSTAILELGYDALNLDSNYFLATMDGLDITSNFSIVTWDEGLFTNCSDLSPNNGLLHITLGFQALEEGNYTMDWSYWIIGYQEPPYPPATLSDSQSTIVEVVYGMDLSFYTGWNLFGVPSNLVDDTVEGVFEDDLGNVDYLYCFDNAAKEYKYWINGLPSGSQLFLNVEPGKGYWAFTNADFNHTIRYQSIGGGSTTPSGAVNLDGSTIYLGYISSTTAGLETTTPLVKDIIEPDLNAYAAKLGYNVTFEFLIDDASGQAAVHLEKVQGFKSIGVNMFIGGGWSSQAQAALSYVNDNDMLMVSSSSTSPLLAISDDNLYRFCPDDTIQAPAISAMVRAHGIEAVIVMQRGDAWADGLYNYFEPAFTGAGGVIVERIRYAGEATEFSNYLATAESIAQDAVATYGWDHVGLELIAFSESVVIVTQAVDYPTLYNLTWFGSDGTTLSQQHCDDAPEQTIHVKLHGTYAAPADSEKFNDLYDRYYALVSQPFGYYSACSYDAAWVLAESILQAQSLDATNVIPIFSDVAGNTFGASGWTQLNEAGDRAMSNYQIWSYRDEGGDCRPYVSGLYDAISGTVTWYTAEMGYTPPTI